MIVKRDLSRPRACLIPVSHPCCIAVSVSLNAALLQRASFFNDVDKIYEELSIFFFFWYFSCARELRQKYYTQRSISCDCTPYIRNMSHSKVCHEVCVLARRVWSHRGGIYRMSRFAARASRFLFQRTLVILVNFLLPSRGTYGKVLEISQSSIVDRVSCPRRTVLALFSTFEKTNENDEFRRRALKDNVDNE